MGRMRHPAFSVPVSVAVVLALSDAGSPVIPADASPPAVAVLAAAVLEERGPGDADRRWRIPLAGARITRPFDAPAHAYAAGHRGVEMRSELTSEVTAPDGGTVAFAGPVAGRGVVTIDHGDGFVSTLEPIDPLVAIGQVVEGGDVVGRVSRGGDTPAGALHFGVRRDGVYIDPMVLLGEVERAVLLPCC